MTATFLTLTRLTNQQLHNRPGHFKDVFQDIFQRLGQVVTKGHMAFCCFKIVPYCDNLSHIHSIVHNTHHYVVIGVYFTGKYYFRVTRISSSEEYARNMLTRI